MNHGITLLDRKTNRYTYIKNEMKNPQSLSNNSIMSMCEDTDGAIWIGTFGGGLNRYNPVDNTFTRHLHIPQNPTSLSSNRVRVVFVDSIGKLWVGTDGDGLNLMKRRSGRFVCFKHQQGVNNSLSDNIVTTVYEDSLGIIWIGTGNGGLNMYQAAQGTFVSFRQNNNQPHSISHNTVYTILEDHAGTLWIGTRGGGINKFVRSKNTFTKFTEKDGLPSNVVNGIVEDDDGFLWISTNNGLTKFNPANNSLVNYSVKDGLIHNEFFRCSYYEGGDGEVFFGGIHGLTSFFPRQIQNNPHVPAIVITEFKIFNQSVPVVARRKSSLTRNISMAKEIRLSQKDRFFSLEFAALDFTIPEKNLYACKLVGRDSDWVYLGNRRSITFSNLAPGNYTLRVKGSNNDGVWNDEGTSIRIIVVASFWQTWWFKAALILALVLLANFAYKMYKYFIALKMSKSEKLKLFFTQYDVSHREQEIITLILQGKSNREIEDELFISLKTVKNHTTNIYKKLGIKTRSQLIVLINNFIEKSQL